MSNWNKMSLREKIIETILVSILIAISIIVTIYDYTNNNNMLNSGIIVGLTIASVIEYVSLFVPKKQESESDK